MVTTRRQSRSAARRMASDESILTTNNEATTTVTSKPNKKSSSSNSPKKHLLLPKENGHYWHKRFDELIKFKSRNRHCHVPSDYAENSRLAKWVADQRIQYHKMKRGQSSLMTREQMKALQSIGFSWGAAQESLLDDDDASTTSNSDDGRRRCLIPNNPDYAGWMDSYTKMLQYKQTTGHCHVPRSYPKLGNWAHRQRRGYKLADAGRPTFLTADQISLLDDIGFVWFPRKTFDYSKKTDEAGWMTSYNELKRYKRQEGHCNVPRSYPKLGNWVHRQRNGYKMLQENKCSYMTERRVALLDELGFVWHPREEFGYQLNVPRVDDEGWMTSFNELTEFYRKEGHCNVTRANNTLGNWVHTQRNNYRNMKLGLSSRMTEERIALLNSIGFVWNPRTSANYVWNADRRDEGGWMVKYEALKKFKEHMGHCNVPRTNKLLGCWVHSQRCRYRNMMRGRGGPMTMERVRKLEEIGFVWRLRGAQDAAPVVKRDIATTSNKQMRETHVHMTEQRPIENDNSILDNSTPPLLSSPTKQKPIKNVNPIQMTNNNIDTPPLSMVLSQQKTMKKSQLASFNLRTHTFLIDSWMRHFDELSRFKSQHNHCHIPKDYNSQLRCWVVQQRKAYRKLKKGDESGGLAEWQILLLENIGFKWRRGRRKRKETVDKK